MAVSFQPATTPAAGTPRLLFEGDYLVTDMWYRNLILSRDGRRFLLARQTGVRGGVRGLSVVLNWFD